MTIRFLNAIRALLLLAIFVTATTAHASSDVVISQVYGGGGNSGATYRNDFVELFNRGTSTVDLTGWSVQYASSSGSSWQVTPLAGSIAPGHYYLVQENAGSGGSVNLPAPDATGGISMSASSGKVALAASASPLAGTCPSVVDFVGFGSANCFEGAAATPGLSNTTAAFRNEDGCADTDDNTGDFSTGSPSPRNSASPVHSCGAVVPSPPTGIGQADPNSVSPGAVTLLTVTVTAGTLPPSTGITVAADLGSIGGVSSQPFYDDGTHGDITAADGTYSFAAHVASSTPLGATSLPVQIGDAEGRSSTTTIDFSVDSPTLAPGTVVISQIYGGGGNSGATLKNDFIELFNRSDSPVDLNGWSVQYINSSGSFDGAMTLLSGVIEPHGYFLIQEAQGTGGTLDLPTPDLSGAIAMGAGGGKIALVASAAALSGACPTGGGIIDFAGYGNANCSETTSIGNLSNTTAAFRKSGGCKETNDNAHDFFVAAPAPRNSSTPVNDCSTVEPPSAPHVVISQIYGGGGNSGAVYSNDFVELYNPTAAAVDLENWSIQYASSTGNTWGSNSQPLGGVIEPGGYFLIELGAGAGGGTPVPSPRIVSDINMSASSGKLALVRRVEGLTGNCPIGDPFLVDFIGYGSADCYEGGLNAPSLNNSQSLLRANGGETDTDQNSDDFTRGTPDPRGSGALVDLAPRITGVDPSGADAPFDASVTINFSEPVMVTGPWFTIGCSSSGPHSDVEVASAFSASTWILTPNVTLIPGELCTVHVVGGLITDLDGAPQNLPSDVEWTFTVATGTPVETAGVHLTMGIPSNASLDDPDDYLMEKPEFALSYNRDRGTANWVSWHLSDEWTSGGSGGRTDTFRPDPALTREWYRVLQTDYAGSGFDRGHMCPSADRTADIPVNQATFLMANMVPQSPDNNQGPWEQFESDLRALLPGNEIYIVSGPEGIGGSGSNGYAETIAGGHVTVPSSTWKVALVLPKMNGDDVSRVTAAVRTIAIDIPNVQGIRTDPWTKYLTTVRSIEDRTGYDFFSNVPEIVQNSIEEGVNGANPPGVADQTETVEAGTATPLLLMAVSPNDGPLTYSILTEPAHGELTGASSEATHTYTPATWFVGEDAFTFRVSDGTSDSIPATVHLDVVDTTAPVISTLVPSLTRLWPVNHKMVGVTLEYSVTDLGDDSPVCSLHVMSNESPDGTGDGTTSPDWEVTDAHHLLLRAERAGTGNGRVYTIGAECADRFGNLSTSDEVTVTVPKSLD
ncbi:MAG: DNA/RNA non-specific endonuclease [Thermoanaerobaculia bacterium]